MKKLSFLLTLLLIMVVAGCKKNTVDVTDLLKSVPSSSAGVIVLNMEGIIADAGCKIKDNEIVLGKEMKALMDKANSIDKKDMMVFFSGDTGIDPKAAIVFYDSNRAFMTFALYDVDKFCKFVEKESEGSFVEENGGVKICGNTAVKGAQAWVCLTSGKTIDADAIASYASLASAQSFLVTPMGEELLTDEEDIRGWALLDTFLNKVLSRQDRNMFTLGLGFLFDNAESVKFTMDFKKGEIEAEAIALNDKGKPAKFQLPADKVDISTLKSLGSTCDGLMAFTVSPKLIKKFDQIGSAFGGALFGDLGESFKNIDGTIGVAVGGTGVGENVNGVITTKGEVSKTVRDMISEYMGPVSMDGKLLRFSKGDVKGNLTVEECAEALKGTCVGVVADASEFKSMNYSNTSLNGFKCVVFKMSPESGGIEFEVEVKTTDPKENALLTIIKSN